MKQPSKAGFTMTREVRASEAKTQFGRLLDAVERGETIVLTRRGRRVARLVPEGGDPQGNHRQAIENIEALGRQIAARNGPISIDEIVSSIHEGHKY